MCYPHGIDQATSYKEVQQIVNPGISSAFGEIAKIEGDTALISDPKQFFHRNAFATSVLRLKDPLRKLEETARITDCTASKPQIVAQYQEIAQRIVALCDAVMHNSSITDVRDETYMLEAMQRLEKMILGAPQSKQASIEVKDIVQDRPREEAFEAFLSTFKSKYGSHKVSCTLFFASDCNAFAELIFKHLMSAGVHAVLFNQGQTLRADECTLLIASRESCTHSDELQKRFRAAPQKFIQALVSGTPLNSFPKFLTEHRTAFVDFRKAENYFVDMIDILNRLHGTFYLNDVNFQEDITSKQQQFSPSSSSQLLQPLQKNYNARRRANPEIVQALSYYVDAFASSSPGSTQVADLKTLALDFLQGDRRQFLLLGDSGSGKSTFLYALEKALWEQSENEIIPILIELKSLPKERLSNPKECLRQLFLDYGYSKNDIEELKKKRTLFLFDGLDELAGEPFGPYRAFGLSEWNAHAIVTCRTQFLSTRPGYQSLFPCRDAFNKECEEWHVAPFSQPQVDNFVSNYVREKGTWIISDFEQAVAKTPNFREFIATPLLLRMVVEVFSPELAKEKLTRYTLYEKFVAEWFERNETRLSKKFGPGITLQSLAPKDAFYRFCERLAMRMVEQGVTEVHYQPPSVANDEYCLDDTPRDDQPMRRWDDFFTDNDPEIALIRGGCPLRAVEKRYSFYHKSLLEFFAASYLVKTLHLGQEGTEVDRKVVSCLPRLPINAAFLSNEPQIIAFLAEKVAQQRGSIERLNRIVLASKTQSKIERAASNAITVLNAARVSFSWQDFSGIQAPKANLDYANFIHCDLRGANLEAAFLRAIWLNQVDLREANLHGVQFGELPTLLHPDSVRQLAYSPDGKLIASTAGSTVFIWNAETSTILHTLQGHGDSVSCLAFSPNGGRLATGSSDKTVRIWDAQTGRSEHHLQGHGSIVFCLAFSPNGGRLATGSDDKTVRIWDVQTGKQVALITLPEPVAHLAYEGNDQLAVACGNGDVFLWRQQPNSDRWRLQWAARKNVVTTSGTRLVGSKASAINNQLLEQRGATPALKELFPTLFSDFARREFIALRKDLNDFLAWHSEQNNSIIRGWPLITALLTNAHALLPSPTFIDPQKMAAGCLLYLLCSPSTRHYPPAWIEKQQHLIKNWRTLFDQFTDTDITQIRAAAFASQGFQWDATFKYKLHTSLGPFLANSTTFPDKKLPFQIESVNTCSTPVRGITIEEGLGIAYHPAFDLDSNPWEVFCLADALSVCNSELPREYRADQYEVGRAIDLTDPATALIAGSQVIKNITPSWEREKNRLSLHLEIDTTLYARLANLGFLSISTPMGPFSREDHVYLPGYQIFFLQQQLFEIVLNKQKLYVKFHYKDQQRNKFIPKINKPGGP